MKFSTVLGSLVLSTLEVYHANAGPLVEASLQERDDNAPQYCCVQIKTINERINKYVLYTGGTVNVYGGDGTCHISATQGKIKPKDHNHGCAYWTFDIESCGRTPYVLDAKTKPAIYCQKNLQTD
ncbi:hypothetical protein E4U55_003434 [Claviceps digitariae]|nr:hypothetical protein E4U55_003434 [Claviceps digitariae]